MKSEPDVWSIDQQKKSGKKGASWDGVRNYQAAKNLKTMKQGDQCYFYHSNIGKEIVGFARPKLVTYAGEYPVVEPLPQAKPKKEKKKWY